MPRKPGSKAAKTLLAEQAEFERIHKDKISVYRSQVDRKFSYIRSGATDDFILSFVKKYRTRERPTERLTRYIRNAEEKFNLPREIDEMELGEDREKAIIAAAQAALIMGSSINQVAARFGLKAADVSNWKDTIITAGAIGRRDRISDMMVLFLEQEIKSLMTISMVTEDVDWILRQDAASLSAFIAVKTDRLYQALQAFGRTLETRQRYLEQLEVIDEDS
jgi:hypothetical protein